MAAKRYYFNEIGEDNVLCYVAEAAKDALQHNEYVVKTYQKYNDEAYAQSSNKASFLMGLHNQLLFSPGPVNSRSCPQYARISSCPETDTEDNEASLNVIPLRKKLSIMKSRSYPKYVRISSSSETDDGHNESSLNVISIREKFPIMKSRSSPQYVRISSSPETDNEHNESSLKLSLSRKKFATMDVKDKISPGKEFNVFSSFKRCKIPGKLAMKDQASAILDEKAKILTSSVQHEVNIASKEGRKAIKKFEDRKTSSLREDIFLFRSMPRFIHSPEAIEIETDISCELVDIPMSLTDIKDEENSPIDWNFYTVKSKPGISQDFSLSSESNLMSPPIAAERNDRDSAHVISLGKDCLSCKPSNQTSAMNNSLETASSPVINKSELDSVKYYLNQLYAQLQLTDKYMIEFLNSLLDFQNDLTFLNAFLETIQHAVQNILVNDEVTKHTEELRKHVFGLATQASKLQKKLISWKIEIDQEIPSWLECFQDIRKLKPVNKPHVHNDQPLETTEFDKVHKDNVKTIQKKLIDMMNIASSRIHLFWTTAQDFMQLINLFVKCLINIGILKPSPSSTL